MNRRSFLAGAGALLATSSLVKPAEPVIEAWTNTSAPGAGYIPPTEEAFSAMFNDIMERMDTHALGDALLYGKPIKTFYEGETWGFKVIDDIVDIPNTMWFLDSTGHLSRLPAAPKPDYDRDLITKL